MKIDVYKLTNKITGKSYIGISSKSAKIRWKDHCAIAKRNGQTYIARAIRKYGAESFALRIVRRVCSWRAAYKLERRMIALHGTLTPGGYNMTKGGEGVAGYKFTEEQIKRLSIAHKDQKGYAWTDEQREYFSKLFKGKPNLKLRGLQKSPETRAKLAAAMRGKTLPEKTRLAVIASNRRRKGEKRRPYPPDFSANVSKALKGRKVPRWIVEKQRASNTGKKRSKEFRESQSRKLLAYYALKREKALLRDPEAVLGRKSPRN